MGIGLMLAFALYYFVIERLTAMLPMVVVRERR